MSKHTPGPWTVGTADAPSRGPRRESLDELSRGQYNVFPLPEDDEVQANARLIAAAPEMLEALEDMAFHYEACLENGTNLVVECDVWMIAVRAAIAHAKGESHQHPCDQCYEDTLCEDYCGNDGQFLCPDCFSDQNATGGE